VYFPKDDFASPSTLKEKEEGIAEIYEKGFAMQVSI
jgi:hypothetical protein